MIRRLLAILALALLVARPADAGDRRLDTLLVDMTPPANATAAAKTCIRDLHAKLAADYAEIDRLGADKLRERAGRPTDESFMAWPAAALSAVKRRKDDSAYDTVILVDCRPESALLDVRVAPAADGTAAIRLRRVAIDRRTTDWIAAAILRRAWAGFSP